MTKIQCWWGYRGKDTFLFFLWASTTYLEDKLSVRIKSSCLLQTACPLPEVRWVCRRDHNYTHQRVCPKAHCLLWTGGRSACAPWSPWIFLRPPLGRDSMPFFFLVYMLILVKRTTRSFFRKSARKIKSFEIIHVWRKLCAYLLCEWWPGWVRYHLLSEFWWFCSIIFFWIFFKRTISIQIPDPLYVFPPFLEACGIFISPSPTRPPLVLEFTMRSPGVGQLSSTGLGI